MKGKVITEIVSEHFKTIDTLCRKILKKFNADDIHDFRVEVKKLRSFLRLLNKQKKVKGALLPDLLKTFYGFTGNIRDVQLHQLSLNKHLEDYRLNKPVKYFQLLEKEENHWKKQAANLMENENFKGVAKDVIKNLPGKLEKAAIKKFAKHKSDKLKKLLREINDETVIHDIRKVLKDIIYTLQYIKAKAKLQKSISDEENLRPLIAALGDFIDKCTQLRFLEPLFLGKLKAKNEKMEMLKVKTEYQHEKVLIIQELHYSLNELNAEL